MKIFVSMSLEFIAHQRKQFIIIYIRTTQITNKQTNKLLNGCCGAMISEFLKLKIVSCRFLHTCHTYDLSIFSNNVHCTNK